LVDGIGLMMLMLCCSDHTGGTRLKGILMIDVISCV
jgi:hypothetical protein